MALELTRQGSFALITLNRPAALNALSFDIICDLGSAIEEVAKQKDVRALFITGAGDRAFCSGADIGELRNRSLIEQKRGSEQGQAVFAKLDNLPVVSVALINGYAFGGGLELALACTFRLAAPTAIFGLPEINLGLIPGYGGTQRLPRLIGESRALDMILTGRTVDATEAEHIGLVNKVARGDLLEAGKAYAVTFSRYSLPALEFSRQAVRRARDLPLAEGLKVEADLSTLAYRLRDAEEGMAAFQEKRRPEFSDE